MKTSENILQEQIVQYIKMQYPQALVCCSLAGMKMTVGQQMKARRMGYHKGFPDLFVYYPSKDKHGLAIEVKTEKGKSSEAQEVTIKMLQSYCYDAHICYGFDAAKDAIDNYMQENSK